ncbi:MAG: TRAM domain-containing protein [Clostridia bacterium]|jgi:23S rRNA (uracil1939-C5)-methyltransferase|nr:TRAM domain-containing protein [Clostridia bacterium]
MECPVVKNEEYVVSIIDNGFEGEGIAKISGFTVFVPCALKGETVRILIVKVLASHAFGKILEILDSSEMRKDVDCLSFKRCGGCVFRHTKYDYTLEIKKEAVKSLIYKELKEKIEIFDVLGMNEPFHYRNKAIYPVRKKF